MTNRIAIPLIIEVFCLVSINSVPFTFFLHTFFLYNLNNLIYHLLANFCCFSFKHYSNNRFSADLSYQNATTILHCLFNFFYRYPHIAICLSSFLISNSDVLKDQRIHSEDITQLTHLFLYANHNLHHLKRCQNTITGRSIFGRKWYRRTCHRLLSFHNRYQVHQRQCTIQSCA